MKDHTLTMAFLFTIAFCLLFELIFHPFVARAATYTLPTMATAYIDRKPAQDTVKPPAPVLFITVDQQRAMTPSVQATTTQKTDIDSLIKEIAMLQALLAQLKRN